MMSTLRKSFAPFENETASLAIGELTIENRLDRVELYGSLQITRDKEGLRAASELKAALDAVVAALHKTCLQDHIENAPAKRIDNPFKD